jgi:hypothetical protein
MVGTDQIWLDFSERLRLPVPVDTINQHITPVQYPPEVTRAVRNAVFIAHHLQNERHYNQVRFEFRSSKLIFFF